MTNGGGTIMLSTHGDIIGPGGESVLALPRGDLLVYHYYDGNNNGLSTLGMKWLGWKDGWPVLREDAPE
jgi:arabinan endo-1,5-alpha-L-arabinosidase